MFQKVRKNIYIFVCKHLSVYLLHQEHCVCEVVVVEIKEMRNDIVYLLCPEESCSRGDARHSCESGQQQSAVLRRARAATVHAA